jgi:hypothetical protein
MITRHAEIFNEWRSYPEKLGASIETYSKYLGIINKGTVESFT